MSDMETSYVYSLKVHEEVLSVPAGIWGGISFERLAEFLEKHGETTKSEKITHFKVENGYVSYRVEYEK